MKKRIMLLAVVMSVALLGTAGCGNADGNAGTPAGGGSKTVQEAAAEDSQTLV